MQTLLNRYLSLDPDSQQRLKPLENKCIAFNLDMMNVSFQIYFSKDKVHIRTDSVVNPDAIISGTPLSLLHMSLNKSLRKQFFIDSVTIEGDVTLGQDVIHLFDEIDIDWEEYLSHWIGDTAAHQVGRFGKKIQILSRDIKNSFTRNVSEYLQEEIQLFPPREALQDFFHDVDQLRMDVDRAIARLNILLKAEAKKED